MVCEVLCRNSEFNYLKIIGLILLIKKITKKSSETACPSGLLVTTIMYVIPPQTFLSYGSGRKTWLIWVFLFLIGWN